jgi:hypothetical protein
MRVLILILSVLANCPVKEKCPFYATVKQTGKPCPLKTSHCPYYDQHLKDHDDKDYLTTKDHVCPLKGKCSFYDDIKNGNVRDYDFEKCPLKGKCPYVDDVKGHGEKLERCPVLGGCPHFKGGKHAEGDASKCPHFKDSGCPYKDSGCPFTADSGCPMDEKCPLYQRLKEGKGLEGLDFDKEGCPMKQKCPLYEKVKGDPSLASGCPFKGKESGCPFAGKEKKEEGCPYKKKGLPCPNADKTKIGKITSTVYVDKPKIVNHIDSDGTVKTEINTETSDQDETSERDEL